MVLSDVLFEIISLTLMRSKVQSLLAIYFMKVTNFCYSCVLTIRKDNPIRVSLFEVSKTSLVPFVGPEMSITEKNTELLIPRSYKDKAKRFANLCQPFHPNGIFQRSSPQLFISSQYFFLVLRFSVFFHSFIPPSRPR